MPDQGQNKGTFAVLAAAAIAVVGVLLGVLQWDLDTASTNAPAPGKKAEAPAAPSQQAAQSVPQPPAPQKAAEPAPTPVSKPIEQVVRASEPQSAPKEPEKSAEASIVPSFDVVRVEADGESVIAGRAAPGATIELLRNDQPHARGVADASGLFAIVPPALPKGSHQIVLQSIAPDGTRQKSRESVTVVLNGDGRPLVALVAPDKPTVLLSNPEPPPEPKPTQEAAVPPASQPTAPQPETPPAQAAAPRPEIKITSVESEEGGRLYVSGQAASNATVRLYLNETFIAPGGAGSDGKVSFAIGRGVQPGDYRVRLDDVDPVSGNVKSRAEVPFNVPPVVAETAPATKPSPAQEAASLARPTPGPVSDSIKPSQLASAEPDGKVSSSSTVVIPDINTAIVSRGDSLWRISRRIYGEGTRYTVIYGANQDQIRNPHKIYPGQVFVLPADQAQN